MARQRAGRCCCARSGSSPVALYPELAHLDEDVAALQLKSVGPQIAHSGGDIAVAERALQRELEAAADRTKKALANKQQEYARREQAAIDAALGAAAGVHGPTGGAIASGINAQAEVQARGASAAAEHNFNAYRAQLVAQDRAAVATLQRTLGERANRTYRSRAEALQRKEADFALQLASDDAAERLSLRTKLSNLASTSRAVSKNSPASTRKHRPVRINRSVRSSGSAAIFTGKWSRRSTVRSKP